MDDVVHFLNHQNITKAIFLGHSYGAKVAYLSGLMYPQFVEGIIALDIAPKPYSSRNHIYIKLLKIFQEIPNKSFASRQEIEEFIFNKMEGELKLFEIKFLISTLIPKSYDTTASNQQCIWKMNIDVLLEQIENITCFKIDEDDMYGSYNGKTYLIRGGDSNFVLDDDLDLIKDKFPNTKLMTVNGASHYLHMDKPQETIKCIVHALNDINPI